MEDISLSSTKRKTAYKMFTTSENPSLKIHGDEEQNNGTFIA